MTADRSTPAAGGTPSPVTPAAPAADDARPVGPLPEHGTTDTLADAADEEGTVRATRRMPEPDSLGG